MDTVELKNENEVCIFENKLESFSNDIFCHCLFNTDPTLFALDALHFDTCIAHKVSNTVDNTDITNIIWSNSSKRTENTLESTSGDIYDNNKAIAFSHKFYGNYSDYGCIVPSFDSLHFKPADINVCIGEELLNEISNRKISYDKSVSSNSSEIDILLLDTE